MKLLKLLLKRIALRPTYTIGKLYIDGVYFCDTIEDPVVDIDKSGRFDGKEKKVYGESAIPYGNYKVILNVSPRFKRLLPRLLDVPHFNGILIHRGNTAIDSHGCIIVGKNKSVGMVIESAATEKELVKRLTGVKDIKIEIV